MNPNQENKAITERLDRLENHFKVYKSDMADVKDSLKEVRVLLGGSSLNGNKGFIKLIETVEEKVDTIEGQIINIQKDIDSTKFWGKTAAGLLVAVILIIINAIKEKL